MKHEKYKELIELNIWGELSEKEEIELQNHLFECDECNIEYAELKKVYSLLTTERPNEPTDLDLRNARARLFNTIRSEVNNEQPGNFLEKLWRSITSSRYSLVFGSIVLVSAGLFIGYLLFTQNNYSNELFANGIDLDKIERGEVEITNVNFPKKYEDEKIFEFKFSENEVENYRGTFDDIVIQQLLAASLVKTKNTGYKIKTANTVNDFVKNNFVPDKKIKDAFINTLKFDENPGVRKSALNALLNFPYDESIRDAMLFTLNNDNNVANRMDAISGLLSMKFDVEPINDSSRINLKQLLDRENNEVIKFRTAKYLLGGK